MKYLLLSVLPLFALFGGCVDSNRSLPSPFADFVFLNAAVYTADETRSWAQAVAIAEGEIVFVGSGEEAQQWIGPNTRQENLEGKMLMPSFHDAHAHIRYGGTSSLGCDLESSPTIVEIQNILRSCIESGRYGPDDWVMGNGWPPAAFKDANPHKSILDEALNGRPAFFSDDFGHNAWVSSKALELAGITATTEDPDKGVIVRDSTTGEPSGTLRETAMALVEGVMPQLTDEQRYTGLQHGLSAANAFGISAFVEPGVSESNLSLYKLADERGELTARVLASLSPIDELPDSVGPELFDLLAKRDKYRGQYLAVDSVKIYIDGVIETRTSYMLEPYLDGENFPPFYAQEELNTLYTKLDGMGIQIHTHAIGDAAIRNALNAYEHMLNENGPNDNRHQMVHLQLVDKQDIPRFGELNVAANFQCMWCYPDVYIDLARDIVGSARVDRFYPVASIQNTDGLLVGGSDWNVSSLNPLDAIETAVSRKNPLSNEGPALGTGEEVDLATALDMYTRNAAYVMRLDDRTGSIEVGKRADLIVLDRNLFEIPVSEINEAKVLRTLLDGQTVYSVN
ncbi:MAG: amidohydrolase [Halioglobus sp.]